MQDRTNEILANLGVSFPVDPLAITGTPDELRQSAVRDRLVDVSTLRSTDYQTLPLYIEGFLLAVIADMFQQDETFTYDPDDELNSQIFISVNWNRGTLESRDRKPKVIVSFQQASSDEEWLRNMGHGLGSGANPLVQETKGLFENMGFRIAVIHHNRSLCLFLAHQIRAQIAAVMEILRATFKLQKVYPPTITGPGQLEEYDDLYGSLIDLRVMAVPKWKLSMPEDYIERIIVATIGTVNKLIEGAILQEQTFNGTETQAGA